MSERVKNNVNSSKYRARNKFFSEFKEGDLVVINTERLISLKQDVLPAARWWLCRAISISKENKFVYRDKRLPWYQMHTKGYDKIFYTRIAEGDTGIFLGRHDGAAVLLIANQILSVPIEIVKKLNHI